ncbi:MAG: hypothetical protein ABI889_15325 [Gemmatimonadota bacterium]
MMKRFALLLTGIALVSGCSDASTSAQSRDLETLRQITAPFRTFSSATSAGWSTQITQCMADSAAGGMGDHYGNTALIDGSVAVNEPELLLYEPQADGSKELVAVEYIVPYTAHARSDVPPELFGQKFKQNDTFQLWGLHVWAWKSNPSGLYADWNPRVNCDNASEGTPPSVHH